MGGAPRRPAAAASSLLLFAVLFGESLALPPSPRRLDFAFTLLLASTLVFGSAAFRALGFGFGVSSASAAFINGALGSKCRPGNATLSKLDIYIEDIQKGKHGSDTGSYDNEGRFVPDKFEEIFAKHAMTVPDALTSDEIDQMLQANRQPGDYSGWAGAEAEWKILYSLGKDKDGLLHKDVVRSVYDGSLFHRLAPNWNTLDKEKLNGIREN
ncbi:hypothetical protein HU200_004059 [Digitaria exilis]|uniref:Peroxygenase 5 n=1 Tax=Digitaria exilis TaxID=1010633 RepID=A0A835FU41_9POAL|nr:hypothetical protein HU200_004059 [Digitaria exilis]